MRLFAYDRLLGDEAATLLVATDPATVAALQSPPAFDTMVVVDVDPPRT